MYDEKGKLTRHGAITVIQSGGSVLVGGKIHTRIDTLPGEAEFAKGNEEAEKKARERLQQSIEDAKAELAKLAAPDKSPEPARPVKPKQPEKSERPEKPGTVSKQDLAAAISDE